ncbi:STAS domain-containing protein [Hymenobacter wooponensis]|uniref:STAS domain-containing protein n=1 Tax=Hymenobacter wooponensis TaxID=1525360 RepID=A0A4Z0MIJ7_9BACT|nr:STAS domain-containing protein [Hymenobacter wooponensis]TGD79642.1 hypothetical protein EU557_15600 [Hymenobacter wooponensis]
MSFQHPNLQSEHYPDSELMAINLDVVEATQIARALARDAQRPRPQLIVDCGHLKCLRTLGVSHVISELLVLHKAGANILLRNVDPALQRCLSLLKLTRVFRTTPKLA